METVLMGKKEYLIDRIEKALYMGFLLDERANELLENFGDGPIVDSDSIARYVSNYNSKLSKKGYPIRFDESVKYNRMTFWLMGDNIMIYDHEVDELLLRLKSRILKNFKVSVTSYHQFGIEIFDLDVMVPLKRTGVTTMGDTYLAFDGKKYAVHFLHLYDVYLGY